MKNRTMRMALLLMIAIVTVVGAVQLTVDTAEAYECGEHFPSCLSWCAADGADHYGSFGACRGSCRRLYCS
jgi:hypothetical protein